MVPRFRKYFTKQIRVSYPDQHAQIITDIDRQNAELSGAVIPVTRSGNPMDRRMPVAGYFLATMMVLEKRGESFERIRDVSLAVATSFVTPRHALERWMKKWPAYFVRTALARMLFRYLEKKLKNRGHPEGFVSKVITDKEQTYGLGYGIDILECGICKLYKKSGYEKYAPILCEIDYITSSLAGLQLIRKGTIANGAEKCDFRFQRKQK